MASDLLYEQIEQLELALKKSQEERAELRAMVLDLFESRDAGCGCDAHPPWACAWHGPLYKARDMLARLP